MIIALEKPLYVNEAFISMNAQKVDKAVYNERVIEIDKDEPFVLTLPINSDPHFYSDGNEVSVIMNCN